MSTRKEYISEAKHRLSHLSDLIASYSERLSKGGLPFDAPRLVTVAAEAAYYIGAAEGAEAEAEKHEAAA